MKVSLKIILSVLPIIVIFGARCRANPEGPYFGQEPPGMVPEIFAPGFISLPGRFERAPNFSPDGKEFYFGVILPDWSDQDIYYTLCDEEGHWADPNEIFFSTSLLAADICLTSDGNTLCFTSNEGTTHFFDNDIWTSERVGGWWDTPAKLSGPINTSNGEWGPSMLANRTIYFARVLSATNPQIYRSRFIGGAYETPVAVPGINTSYEEWDPYVPDDESYMIFKTNRPGSYGNNDLYISFNNDGSWTTPKNLGPTINTSMEDDCGSITPDGKYYIFARRNGDTEMDLYWVDVRAIFPKGDFTRDGRVDFEDFAMFAESWLAEEEFIDIAPDEPDGIVNFLDFSAFAQHWLETWY